MADDSALSGLLSSATLVLTGGLLASFSKVLERIIIGRALSPGAYGEVSIGFALLSFGTTISLVGFSHGIPRYVSRYEEEADRRGVWLGAFVFTGAVSLLLASLLWWQQETVVATLFEDPDSPRLLGLFLVALPFVVGMRVGVNTIRGLENTRFKLYTQDLTYPVGRLVILGALLLSGGGLLAAGYAYVAAAALAFLLSHVLLSRLMSLTGPVRLHFREVLVFSLPVIISGVLGVLLTRTDTLMLGYFSSSEEVGYYSAAYPLASGMLIVLSAFGFLYLPLASRLDADDEHGEMEAIYETTTRWIYVVTFPAFVAFVAFPGDVISVFFGQNYVSGAPALSILALGFFANALCGRNRETISALGRTEFLVVANGAAFALNIAMNVVLIPRYGLLGASVASAVSYVTMNVVATGVLMYLYDISPFNGVAVRSFLLLPVVVFPPVWLLSELIDLNIFTLGPFLAVVGVVSIGILAVAGLLQPEDRVVLEFVEEQTGVRVPYVRNFIPSG